MRSTRIGTLELYTDVVYPWCWIGDRRLAAAVHTVQREMPDVTFDVAWRPPPARPHGSS